MYQDCQLCNQQLLLCFKFLPFFKTRFVYIPYIKAQMRCSKFFKAKKLFSLSQKAFVPHLIKKELSELK